ncbi:PREDICTED: type-1 angiotensin II receptor-associated protein isoform X1 [Vollenhovia emeryi]|uniref:type-1 angiotensin II receptor-associated protein isoform X1 n=2 Tax=Vollenhovia emeryi TaxID=411798 RepID=UPI0005F38A31|nr:PREDICTED: type-1 angiotensin II receptor-associated protein isoform X1 [Vollenhovia emeryi]
MPNLTNLSHFPLKIIFAIHLILVTWGMQGGWCPKSVLLYNLLFFVCIFWAVHSVESDEPLQFALFINVLSIFLDVITLAVYYPSEYNNASNKFSAALMIINLIVRPVSSIYLLRIGQGRGGNLATVFAPSPAMGYGRQDYEEISHPVPQNSDFEGV